MNACVERSQANLSCVFDKPRIRLLPLNRYHAVVEKNVSGYYTVYNQIQLNSRVIVGIN